MGRYDFVSPGAAAGQGLDEVLVRNRLEARQKLLDDLQRQQVESNMAYRQAEAASQAEYQHGRAVREQAEADKLADEKTNRANYLTGMQDYMAGPEYAKLDPHVQQAIKLAHISGDEATLKGIMGSLSKPQTPMVPGMVFDQEQGTISPMIGPDKKPYMVKEGTQPYNRVRPPREPAVPKSTYAAPGLTTDKGQLITVIDGIPYAVNPATGKNEVYTGKVGAKPSSAGTKKGAIPFAAFKDVTAKTAKATEGVHWWNPSAKPGDIAAKNSAIQAAVATYPTTQDVRDTAMDIMFNPKTDPNLTTEELIQRHINPEDWENPDDLNDLRNLLNGLRQK
jgi:hypothetical protein